MTRPGRRTSRGSALLAALATMAAAALALAPAARADSPQQRAAALAAQVRTLQAQAERETEAYDAAQGHLGLVVAESLIAEQAVVQALAVDTTRHQDADQAVRSLYEMGGPTALYAGVIAGGGDPSVVQEQLVAVGRILAGDRAAAVSADLRSSVAAAYQQRADRLANEQTVLEGQVAARAQAVQTSLANTQALLANADAEVAAIAQADEQSQLAADHAAFLSQYDAALASTAGLGGPPASPAAGIALATAQGLSGHPYQWGGTGPVGYDCSGMTGAAFAAAGILLPRTAAEQYLAGPHVGLGNLLPGDLLFWASNPADPSTIEHVAIYAGAGLMVSADHTGDFVRLQPVWWSGYAGATRPNALMAAQAGGPRWAPGQTG